VSGGNVAGDTITVTEVQIVNGVETFVQVTYFRPEGATGYQPLLQKSQVSGKN
jgi:hypothetical protein